MYEVIGIIASLIVLISFLFKEERQIRMVNIFGAILFVIYGLFIQSFSVWFLNGTLCLIHINRLFKK